MTGGSGTPQAGQLRTPFQHNIEVPGGLIVDWTYRQIEPGAAWPHVAPLAEFWIDFGPSHPICSGPLCRAS